MLFIRKTPGTFMCPWKSFPTSVTQVHYADAPVNLHVYQHLKITHDRYIMLLVENLR